MISILMPLYNGVEFLDESVTSVLTQTSDCWELLIAVNGHPPMSDVYMTAKAYEQINNKIRVFDFHTIKGKANTLNEMVKHCSYDYVAILDVDDIWHPNKLEIQLPYLENYDVIGSNCVWFGERENVVPPIPLGDISSFDFKFVNPIINSSSIIKKTLCYWSSEYYGVEDYELWLRLRQLGKKFFNCTEILVKHRIHGGSAFNSNQKQSVDLSILLQKY
jgi:glycosyltransferase involved in cell wall biosynthesis